jgi:3'(2'), 5'-bisphosphate nucleotidase
MSFDRELAVALQATSLACAKLRELYAEFQAIPDAPASISTDADRQSQEIILGCIRRAFPGDALCAEEDTASLDQTARTGERLWIVDPIDGTRGFARKNGEFSVMIAFAEHRQIGIGVVAEPALHRLTYAVRGDGCWRLDDPNSDPVRCQVGAAGELGAAVLTQSRSRHPNVPSRHVVALKPARVVETYSAGIKLALVARGEADLYLNTYDAFHDWDIAAGHILVEEAGGRVTGTGGEPLLYGLPGAKQTHGLLASNGLLHDAALAALRSIA